MKRGFIICLKIKYIKLPIFEILHICQGQWVNSTISNKWITLSAMIQIRLFRFRLFLKLPYLSPPCTIKFWSLPKATLERILGLWTLPIGNSFFQNVPIISDPEPAGWTQIYTNLYGWNLVNPGSYISHMTQGPSGPCSPMWLGFETGKQTNNA